MVTATSTTSHYKLSLYRLGKAVVSTFNPLWRVTNIDLTENKDCYKNILIDKNQKLSAQLPKILKQVEKASKEYEAIICVAGGWAGGSIKDADIFDKYELMAEQSVVSSLLGNDFPILLEC